MQPVCATELNGVLRTLRSREPWTAALFDTALSGTDPYSSAYPAFPVPPVRAPDPPTLPKKPFVSRCPFVVVCSHSVAPSLRHSLHSLTALATLTALTHSLTALLTHSLTHCTHSLPHSLHSTPSLHSSLTPLTPSLPHSLALYAVPGGWPDPGEVAVQVDVKGPDDVHVQDRRRWWRRRGPHPPHQRLLRRPHRPADRRTPVCAVCGPDVRRVGGGGVGRAGHSAGCGGAGRHRPPGVACIRCTDACAPEWRAAQRAGAPPQPQP